MLTPDRQLQQQCPVAPMGHQRSSLEWNAQPNETYDNQPAYFTALWPGHASRNDLQNVIHLQPMGKGFDNDVMARSTGSVGRAI